jgi:uncharacterized protein YndB with AHSA1/START domain
MTSVTDATDSPVRKTITVNASPEQAFRVFTEGFDTWWPRSHSIGGHPMKHAIIETKPGGRCYQQSMDGRECDWGRVILWDPPRRFVLAWQLNEKWEFDSDITKASEVEVHFTPLPDGSTRVDLEHRRFDRHGAGGPVVREAVDSPQGWGDLLQMYAAVAATARDASASRSVLAALGPLELIFKLNTGLMRSSFDGVPAEDFWRRPAPAANPLLWVLGHLVSTRAIMLTFLGDAFDTGWGDLFARGATVGESSRYPSRDEIERVHRQIVTRLKDRFAALTAADLERPAVGKPIGGAKTIADQLAAFAFHESYHVGQLVYIRRSLGHASIAG